MVFLICFVTLGTVIFQYGRHQPESKTMVLKLQYTSLSLDGGLVSVQVPGPCPQSFDSVDLGWGLGTCISNKSHVIFMPLDPGTTFENR